MKDMRSVPLSELSWVLKDYEAAGEEAPDRILERPEACEGELMSGEEIEEYIRDAIATITIMRDEGSRRLEKVHQSFVADLAFLFSLGRVELDEYNELKNLETYKF